MIKQKRTQIYQIILTSLCGIILCLGLFQPVTVFAQNGVPSVPQIESDTLTDIELLDEQAQDRQIASLNERQLRDLKQELETENITLEQEILTLLNQRDELVNTLERLQQLKDSTDTDEFIANLDSEISTAQTELAALETVLARKESREIANTNTINRIEDQLDTLSQEIEQDTSTLQSQIFELFSKYSFYFGLIIVYFAVQQLLNILTDRFIKSEIARDVIKFIITAIVIIATILTLLLAFIGNLTYLLTGLGVISAALVVALQDFVSSMFAFFWIKLRRIYKNRDVIDLNTGSTGTVTGIVMTVGIFRTSLKELYGEGELNAERSSGRIVSVPNNIILKTPVTNYTQDNRILWHVMSVTITFESDFEEAREQLENIVNKQFKYALDHRDQLLDDAFNLEYVYAPKVFMNIAGSGPQFDIWFAARYGHYREVREELSAAILHSFRTHGIDLAYNTTRIIPTPKRENDESTIAFHNQGIFADK
jgi:small-conductance mechanosensitive channel